MFGAMRDMRPHPLDRGKVHVSGRRQEGLRSGTQKDHAVNLEDLAWFALKTVPAAEFRAASQLVQLGHKTLVPKEHYWSRIGSTTKTEEKPLPIFRSYAFAGFDGTPNWYLLKRGLEDLLQKTPGRPFIRGIVGFGGRPARLSRDNVDFLLELNGQKVPSASQLRGIKVGDRARITSESFRDHEVTVMDIDPDAKKARILLQFLGSPQIIPISVAALEKV